MGKLSQIGIEIINDTDNDKIGNSLSKAIYEITRDSSKMDDDKKSDE